MSDTEPWLDETSNNADGPSTPAHSTQQRGTPWLAWTLTAFAASALTLAVIAATTTTTGRNVTEAEHLDVLHSGCANGDLSACDALYLRSPAGSAYETFGATCGGRTSPDRWCDPGTEDRMLALGTYGDDTDLDNLVELCGSGDLSACDTLYVDAPSGSWYERFGSTCGDRDPSGDGWCDPDRA